MKKGIVISVIAILVVITIALGVLYVTNNTDKTRTIDELNSTISEEENLIETLNMDIASKEAIISDLNADIVSKETTISDLNADIASKETTIADVNKDIAYKTGQIETLKEDISKKETQIEELKKSEEGKTEEIEALYIDVEKLTSNVKKISAELDEYEKQVVALQKEIQKATSEISELKATISEKDAVIKKLEDKLASIEISPTPTEKQYAGATPVPIFPLERPTATPLPELEFSYREYDATSNLGVSFDAPIGWDIDYGIDYYKLTNPDLSVDYQAFILLKKEIGDKNYSKIELTDMLKSKLESIGEEVNNFSPSNTAERTFMGKAGIYANYKGIADDAAEIGGSIIVAQVNEAIYYLHVSYPKAYTDTYVTNVYDKIRHTIQVQ